MKEVLDLLTSTHKDDKFLSNQYQDVHWNKNILFIRPQLNGRHFYRYILPYFVMWEFDYWGTAITNIDKYKPFKEYEPTKDRINSKQILWSDYIVFPFSNMPLKEVYEQLKAINPNVKIVYNVDFNYYKLNKNHPLYDQFSDEETVSTIEDNIFYSDITLVTNTKLSEFLIEKFSKELKDKKYQGVDANCQIGVFPIFMDKEIILENVPMEVEPLPEKEQEKLRIGMVATNYSWQDIESYKKYFQEVKDEMGDKVEFVMLGFDGKDKATEKSCFPEGFEFTHVNPCSIIHYYKELKNMQLDMLFIPLRQTEYNMTTENYNKFLEAGLFKIPVMVYDIFPYSELIKNGQNGIILKKKKEFVERIKHFEENRDELKRMGDNAYQMVEDNFCYHRDNLPIIDKIFSTNE